MPAAADGPPAIVPAPRLVPTEATRRWAALLLQIIAVDPLTCPTCHGTMRVVACITQASVVNQILTHLRAGAAHVSMAPQRPATTRGRSTRAAVPPRRHRGPRRARVTPMRGRPNGPHGVRVRRRARRRQLAAARQARERGLDSTCLD